MTYVIQTNELNEKIIAIGQMAIPIEPANRHYQEVLDAIIEQGADCFDGDIPADLQAAADAKLFAQQLADLTATDRSA